MHRAKIGAEGGYEPELLREFCGSKSYCPPEMLAAQPYVLPLPLTLTLAPAPNAYP